MGKRGPSARAFSSGVEEFKEADTAIPIGIKFSEDHTRIFVAWFEGVFDNRLNALSRNTLFGQKRRLIRRVRAIDHHRDLIQRHKAVSVFVDLQKIACALGHENRLKLVEPDFAIGV